MNNFLLYGCATACLFIHLLMDVWVVPVFGNDEQNRYEHLHVSLWHKAFDATIRTDWKTLMYYLDNGLRGRKANAECFITEYSKLMPFMELKEK